VFCEAEIGFFQAALNVGPTPSTVRGISGERHVEEVLASWHLADELAHFACTVGHKAVAFDCMLSSLKALVIGAPAG